MSFDVSQFTSFVSSIPILEKMGITIESLTESSVITKVPFEGNTNHIGTIYAGVIFSLAEFTGVPLMFPKLGKEGIIFIIRDMSIRYRRPATTDLTVTANFSDEDAAFCKAEIAKNGKVDFMIEMHVKDTTGEVVAITKNNYHLIKT